ncbi:MAG: response regulator transcription factor [Gammaproteobacteria bacterium]|nr:response regulator transcription factor [Gammaproteobacteria bacterium]
MTERGIRILLVDDHAVVRAGYRLLLQNAPAITIVAEAEDGESAYRAFVESRPDVVVMDLTLPGPSGLDVIRRVIARDPRARILVFSMHEEPIFAEQALAAGARGYLTKASAPDALVDAIRDIARGGIFVETAIAQQLAVQKCRGEATPFRDLTTREFEICRLLVEGASVAEIAQKVALSAKTVANYSTQIREKVGAGSTAELTRLAIRYGIISA